MKNTPFSVSMRADHSLGNFLKRTIAGQIHLVGFFASLVGTVYLIYAASLRHDSAGIIACAVFGTTGAFVFGVSAAYHFLHDGFCMSESLENFFEKLDHASIYCFIAGTYTVFLINVVSLFWQAVMISFVWIVATIGIVYTWYRMLLPRWMQSRWFYTSLFVLMGWTLIFRIGEIYLGTTFLQRLFLLVGGALYTLGAVVYGTKRPRLFPSVFGYHELWHTLVLAAFVMHYGMILDFYLPLMATDTTLK
jgi:hemolysin III